MTAITLGCLLSLAPGADAAELVRVGSLPAALDLEPLVSGEYQAMHLTISGQGRVIERVFGAAEAMVFDVGDLPDGNYTWEVSLVPKSKLRRGDGIGIASPRRTQSGYFTVAGGVRVDENLPEAEGLHGETSNLVGETSEDQQILDDLIVRGSICAGLDCNNGESFGFDTIRLKENNLRLKFEDTSTSASFPSTDWQLTANDSANGGANKFSIDDISGGFTPFTIEATAPSHSLYVADNGFIGFSTSTPVVDLHVKSGNTPTLRLEQDGTAGFTPQTWDVAGNETNFFIRDVTNGSTLPFRIEDGAPTNAIYIDSTGNVGVGTTSPDEEVNIQSNQNPALRLTNSATAGGSWDVFLNSNTKRLTLREISTGNVPVKIASTANTNLFQVGIDAVNVEVADQVTIDGNLVLTGTCGTCDGIFEQDYPLESIDEHAASMWHEGYLPGVGPTHDGATTINVFQKTTGMLQELEKAHIYIEQLHRSIRNLEARLEALENGSED